MKTIALVLSAACLLTCCVSKTKIDDSMLEKYPACYNKNIKIVNKCIDLNESGKVTTALQLENAAYAGQYQ